MIAGDAFRLLRDFPMAGADFLPGPALILAPHPDDESLGTGGLIAMLAAAGRPPFVVFVTDGAGSHPGSAAYPPARLVTVREAEATEACAALGLGRDRLAFLRLPDTDAPMGGPAFNRAVTTIADRCRAVHAAAILAPWEHDPHCDHLATHRMAVTVAAQLGIAHWAYPVWGWTLAPNHVLPDQAYDGVRIDIAPWLSRKRQAIAAHRSQYAGLITDDPAGFVLPADLLAIFDEPVETFLRL